jgi:DnaJ-domain-containing protein 1
MTDHFILLDESRRPWLNPDSLKEKFLALSSKVHPDRVHQLGESEKTAAHEKYIALNAAYACLREPKDRLRHFLELELGERPKEIQQIPPELMETFFKVGQACREAEPLLADSARNASPLLKVKWFERSQNCVEKLRDVLKPVLADREQLIATLKELDAKWIASDASDSAKRAELLSKLEELYRLFSYYDRWIAQLQDRIARLSF